MVRPIYLLYLMVFLVISPACGRASDFTDAQRAFSSRSIPERMQLQLYLTAAGYWPAVPNVDFNHRLFDAISRYQADNGLPSTGLLDDSAVNVLRERAAPMLALWQFRSVRHPARGLPIWVPLGLGLRPEPSQKGTIWKNGAGSISIAYDYFDSMSLDGVFLSMLEVLGRRNATIHYKILRGNFFAISATSGENDIYIRFHSEGAGIIGFWLNWYTNLADLHMERVATLMSGSLWSAKTGAPFPSLPAIREPPQPSPPVVASAPASPDGAQAAGSSGTGFFVSDEGLVLTNAHVVEGCSTIIASSGATTFTKADVLAKDVVNDLALLQTGLKPRQTVAIRPAIRIGETVEAFGFPLSDVLSSSGNFTIGNVTALSGIGDDIRFVQVSTPVQPGNSGGPLLDQFGNVVGIVTSKLNAQKIMLVTKGDIPQNVNFAVKAGIIMTFLDANRVILKKAPSAAVMLAPDIADFARDASVFIRCN